MPDAPKKNKRSRRGRNARISRNTTVVKIRGKGDYTIPDAEYDALQAAKIENVALRRRLEKSETFKSNLRSGGRALGAAVGSYLPIGGTAAGAKLGDAAGGMLARLFGHGDFKLRGNSLMQGLPESQSMVPVFGEKGRRGVRIMEREYVGDITAAGALVNGSTAFSVQSYSINPQNPKLFPWLSKFANLFDQWEPNGIVLEYVSTSSEFNGSSQALGAVVCATDYNAFDVTYTNKQEMEEADYANSVKASECLMHGIECAPTERPTRTLFTGPVEPNDNQNLYNLGNFQIATQGMSVSGVTVGELWISYDITFYKKQVNPLGMQIPYFSFFGTPVSTTNLFGTINPLNARGTLPCVVDTNNKITFPSYITAGIFIVILHISAASGTPNLSSVTYSNCGPTAGGNYPLPIQAPSATDTIYHTTVVISGPSASLTYAVSSIGVTPGVWIEVVQAPSNLPYTNNAAA